MEFTNTLWIKLSLLIAIIVIIIYSISYQTSNFGIHHLSKIINSRLLAQSTEKKVPMLIENRSITTATTLSTSETTTTLLTTSTAGLQTTIDPANLISERPAIPAVVDVKTSNGSIAVFIFHTRHHVLASVQMYMIKKLAINLVDIELFVDGPISNLMKESAAKYGAKVYSFPQNLHTKDAGASDRNTEIVNWALTTRAKHHLSNGTAVLLLDGDVIPLSPFDSVTLLNSRRLVCRKHPAVASRYCWIGLICLSPEMASTIHELDVSQTNRNGVGYDSGGKTIEYLLKYPNASFAYMRETILLGEDKTLFWGAMDDDIRWIGIHFSRCDKCGPEVFFSPFSDSNAVFYHMISATSEWRFGDQNERRQSIFNEVMKSPYGPNRTLPLSDVLVSVKRVQKMDLIPMFGNLTCTNVCG